MSDKYPDLLKSLLRLHEMRIEQILIQSDVDLDGFFDYCQMRLNRSLANHRENEQFRNIAPGSGWFDNTEFIEDVKKIQGIIIKLLPKASAEPKNKYSYSEFAMALQIKAITINKKGTGINDGIDYAKKFNLNSGNKLYNKLNDIVNDKLVDPEPFKTVAKTIIKEYNL